MRKMTITKKFRMNTPSDAEFIAKKLCKYDYDIDAVIGRYVINAKSLLGLLSLTPPKIIDISIHTDNVKIAEEIFNNISELKETE